MEITSFKTKLTDIQQRIELLRGYLDYGAKAERLEEVELELGAPDVWENQDHAQKLGKERASLELVVETIRDLSRTFDEISELLDLAINEEDESTFEALLSDTQVLEEKLEILEFRRMFSGSMDVNSAFVDIQSGSGGTEAQDWAEMLLRMYLRWCEAKGFKVDLIENSPGDVAGIKSATFEVSGEYAFGWLRTEIGVHRLVRKSPFDSSNKRHTSFAAVFVSPDIDDDIDIEIDPSDVRTDTYRASGAGGQHVNKTDSAVRLTHLPTGVVVQSQSQRSQHQNRDKCWQMLRAKLYELEVQKRKDVAQKDEDNKADIGWGSQIRSYVLDDSRVKDLRTSVETRNTQAVLDGSLDQFIVESLKAGL
ncbi:MAG: peptide chain release factor 2 [Pseudomonadota bacterium]|nr:peptide chain release factor 2 [Porticoccaceae bacterium]MEC7158204.1 peptide chain release factor 2 [Pseudomonadota bacterium]MDP7404628.1 peptide chain release factor 2 [Porticoccaceae bacterium]MEC7389835.1 peptide chain release factor 2 [Pseudomonadota bacterium]MEC7455093.1 peptide chain release factor 2 [Pseudomonadota bacterium]